MSDDATAAGTAGSEQETIAGVQGGAEGADAGNAGAQGGAAAGLASLAEDSGEPAAPADWPEDWRERIAGNDEKELSRLKRFASLENLHKSYRQLEKRLSERQAVPILPEDATEEQVAEYRKAVGVPESPDGYGVQFAPELAADEGLQTMLQGFLAHAHERNLPPAAVKAAVEWQQQQLLQQREEQAAAAARERARVTAALRKEYGSDYKRNLALADEFLAARPGLAKLVRADNPDLELVRDIISLARDTAPEDVLYSGDGDSGGKSLDEMKEELVNKSIRGKLTPAEDTRLNQIYEMIEARTQRRQRSRAA